MTIPLSRASDALVSILQRHGYRPDGRCIAGQPVEETK